MSLSRPRLALFRSKKDAMTDPVEPAPDEAAQDQAAFDLEMEADRRKREEDRERFMQILGFKQQELPVLDHGTTSGHPLSRDEGFNLKMDSGGNAWLEKLVQSRTYAGVLLGVPDDPVEQFMGAMRCVKDYFAFYEGIACVLPPRLHKGRRRVLQDGVEEFRDWQLLPGVTCHALLTSSDLAQDDSSSSVVVIWYQDGFGLPDQGVLAQMRSIRWRRHAFDWGW